MPFGIPRERFPRIRNVGYIEAHFKLVRRKSEYLIHVIERHPALDKLNVVRGKRAAVIQNIRENVVRTQRFEFFHAFIFLDEGHHEDEENKDEENKDDLYVAARLVH